MKLFGTSEIRGNDLYIGGINSLDLVKEYGTPIYVMDEALIRDNCRKFMNSFRGNDGINKVIYAGKAFLTLAMAKLINEEGLNLDVVSGGELYTAYKSGFPLDKVYFHGNSKTKDEIDMGVSYGVGTFVCDNLSELKQIQASACKNNVVQNIILRITPGVEAHTHEYIKTGQIDSKFGLTLENGEAFKVLEEVPKMKNIHLNGFHCHIGSQTFNTEGHKEAIRIMMNFIKDVMAMGFKVNELNLGGGFGIYYCEGDSPLAIEEYCKILIDTANEVSLEVGIPVPRLCIEPGRSIVGNAGTTLYTVSAIKDIPGIRKYVSVDGGMSDNIRPALYQAEYECIVANKCSEKPEENITLSGKCCESGDILINNICLPHIEINDIIAVASTGAYCYTMSSNYNRIPKAPVVMVKDGNRKVICRRETYEDLIRNDVI